MCINALEPPTCHAEGTVTMSYLWTGVILIFLILHSMSLHVTINCCSSPDESLRVQRLTSAAPLLGAQEAGREEWRLRPDLCTVPHTPARYILLNTSLPHIKHQSESNIAPLRPHWLLILTQEQVMSLPMSISCQIVKP